MKQCTKCRKRKPLTEFHSNGGGRYRGACKPCESLRDKARYKPRLTYRELREEPWCMPEDCRNTQRDATKHPLYETWRSMIARSANPNDASFDNYGGRGISVCSEWLDNFWSFAQDMGGKPTPDHSLDRIDNDGDYSPGNCRWATSQEQSRNTRLTRRVDFFGESVSVIELAETYSIGLESLKRRLDSGWCLYAALCTPRYTHLKTTTGLLASYEMA